MQSKWKNKMDLFAIESKYGEPWVNLPDNSALSNWGKDQEIVYNQMNRNVQKAKFYSKTFDFLTENQIVGDYLEFGCHRCRTLRMALTEARRHNLSSMNFHAFDSFEGLPEVISDTDHALWRPAALATSLDDFIKIVQKHGIYPENVRTIKGFYQNSLTPTLQEAMLVSGQLAMLVTVDCDLYESAVPVFRFIEPLLQEGTVIYIDDLFAGYRGSPKRGVSRAFMEFQKNTPWKFVRHLDVGWWGRSYIAYRDNADLEGTL